MTVTTSETVAKLAAALIKAQQQCDTPSKDARNPHFGSTYADLPSVRAAMVPAFLANDLAVVQMPGFEGGVATLTNRILHGSGEWIEWTAAAPVGKADAQGWRGAVTYLRRTCLEGIANLAAEDDDGNTAAQRPKAPPPAPAPKRANVAVVPVGKAPPEGKKGEPLSSLNDADLASLKAWYVKTDPTKWAKCIAEVEEQQEANRIAASDGK